MHPGNANPIVQACLPGTERWQSHRTAYFLAIPGVSHSWFSRITVPFFPSPGALVLFLKLYPQLPSTLRDQLGDRKSTFQGTAVWTG